MKYHDNKIHLTYAEFVPDIMGKPNYDQSKSRKAIKVIGRGGNGSEILIEYETLPPKYKEAVTKQYGNPYEYIAKQPILNHINWDYEAEKFYTSYVLPNRSKLPEEYVNKYTKTVSWLNTINHFTTDKRALKRDLNISIATFWQMVSSLIHAKEVSLPTSEKRLKEKIKQFKADGYGCVIEAWRFGNDFSKKVKDEVAESVLITMINHEHKHDDTRIALYYNEWATANNYAPITANAVGIWRRKTEHLTTANREGNAII